eukprot:g10229.t1
MRRIVFLLAAVLTVDGSTAAAQSDASNRSGLDRYFSPPPQFAKQFGNFASPLKFYDGRTVKTSKDWSARRKEILDRWHKLMGPWPALLKMPKLVTVKKDRRENFTRHHVRIEVADGLLVPAILLIPDGKGPFPAAVVTYYDAKTGAGLGKELRDFGYQLTKRGFVTLSIGGFQPRRQRQDEVHIQQLSFEAYGLANCHTALTHLSHVDPRRIGVVGHSYGGKKAMFASCLFEKFACAAWSDGGIVFDEKRSNVNYWEPWYLGYEPGKKQRRAGIPADTNPRTGAYKRLVEQGLDLHELHALMAPRPFLVSGGAEDRPQRWVPLNHTIAVNKLLGYRNRVAMTNRKGHSPTEESNAQIYAFFERFLLLKENRSKSRHGESTAADSQVAFAQVDESQLRDVEAGLSFQHSRAETRLRSRTSLRIDDDGSIRFKARTRLRYRYEFEAADGTRIQIKARANLRYSAKVDDNGDLKIKTRAKLQISLLQESVNTNTDSLFNASDNNELFSALTKALNVFNEVVNHATSEFLNGDILNGDGLITDLVDAFNELADATGFNQQDTLPQPDLPTFIEPATGDDAIVESSTASEPLVTPDAPSPINVLRETNLENKPVEESPSAATFVTDELSAVKTPEAPAVVATNEPVATGDSLDYQALRLKLRFEFTESLYQVLDVFDGHSTRLTARRQLRGDPTRAVSAAVLPEHFTHRRQQLRVQVIGNTGVVLTDIAFDADGNLYGISFTDFYRVNPATAAVTLIGAHGIPGGNALEFGPNGVLYAAGETTSSLFSINPQTGRSSYRRFIGYESGGDLAYRNGDLFLTSNTDELIRIPLASGGGGTIVGSLNQVDVYGLDVATDGAMYAVAGTVLSRIDPATGAGTVIANYSGQGLGTAYGASASQITLPATNAGNIEMPGDVDWFSFTALAGCNYRIETHLGSLSDTVLRLIDRDGTTQLRFDDDGGPGLASLIDWTPQTTGRYFVEVSGYGSGTGEYGVNVSATDPLCGFVTDLPVAIRRFDNPASAVETNRRTWVVMHGNNSSSQAGYVTALAQAVDEVSGTDQVLVVDWSTIAGLATGTTETRIPDVAAWVSRVLVDSGFSGSVLNMIGHSFGSYVSAEAAGRIPGGVNTIVALDAARDVPFYSTFNPDGRIDFAADTANSWSFRVLSGPFGSNLTPVTADEAFLVTSSEHTEVVTLFTNLLRGRGDQSVDQHFSLSRLLFGANRPWIENQYDENGTRAGTGGFEAIIRTQASDHTRAASIEFVSSTPPAGVPAFTGPTSSTADTTPTISWGAVNGATAYELLVYNIDAGQAVIHRTNLSSTSYTPPNALGRQTRYQAFVRAGSAGQFGNWSAPHVFTVTGGVAVPSPPTITGPAATTNGSAPTITWTGGSGAATYDVLVYNIGAGTEVINSRNRTGTSLTPAGPLPAGGRFQVFVRGVNSAGAGAWSAAYEFQVGGVPQGPPAAPTNLVPVNGSLSASATPLFDWNDMPGATTYRLLAYNKAIGADVINQSGLTASRFQQTVALAPGAYEFYLQAQNASGASAFARSDFTVAGAALTAPVLTSPGGRTTDSTPTLTWNAVSGVNQYQTQLYSVETGQLVALRNISRTFDTPVTPLSKGRYQFYVRALSSGSFGSFSRVDFEVVSNMTVDGGSLLSTIEEPVDGESPVAESPADTLSAASSAGVATFPEVGRKPLMSKEPRPAPTKHAVDFVLADWPENEWWTGDRCTAPATGRDDDRGFDMANVAPASRHEPAATEIATAERTTLHHAEASFAIGGVVPALFAAFNRKRDRADKRKPRVLQQEFTAERLQEARVLVQDQAGELQLSPVLTGSGFLVLRPSQDGAPFDIVSGGGSLASCEPPAFRCHEDFYTRTWCNEPAVILVALCDVDLALLRMLSIPSTPAAGLRDLTGEQVRRLFGLANRHRTVPEPVESPIAGHDCRFVIVGCRLAGLLKEVPSEFTETISRLSNVEKSYRISTSERFAVWEPTDGELDQMRSAVEFDDRPLVRHAIMQSVSRSTLPVRRYIEKKRNALLIHNLCTARRELTEALNKSKARRVPTPELSQKFDAFNRCYHQTFVEPIENSARSLQQPEKQGLGLLAADLMRHWHEMSEFDCAPAAAVDPLTFLTFDADVRTCPSEPAAVSAKLCDEFPVEILVASGVVEQAVDGSVQLTPALSTPGELLIVLRDAETNAPFDVLSDAGHVSPLEIPAFASLRDARTRRCLENGDGALFVACRVADAAVLRACGLPVTLAHGLEKLPLDQLARFCESFGLTSDHCDRDRRPDDPAAQENPTAGHAEEESLPPDPASPEPHPAARVETPVHLVFVGWTPACVALAVPIPLHKIVVYFELLKKHLGLDMNDLGLWEPSADDMARLQFIAEGRASVMFENELLDSADDVLFSLADFGSGQKQPPGPPTDYVAALARLYAAGSRDDHSCRMGPDDRKREWKHVQNLLQQQIIQPLRDFAMVAGNPLQQSLLLCFAELTHVFHTQAVSVNEKLNRNVAQQGIDNAEALPSAEFKNLLNMADQLIELAKAISPCRPPKATVVQPRVIESRTTPRLPHSGAVAGELQMLQARVTARRKLTAITRLAGQMLRDAKTRLEPILEMNGFVFHGMSVRRARQRTADTFSSSPDSQRKKKDITMNKPDTQTAAAAVSAPAAEISDRASAADRHEARLGLVLDYQATALQKEQILDANIAVINGGLMHLALWIQETIEESAESGPRSLDRLQEAMQAIDALLRVTRQPNMTTPFDPRELRTVHLVPLTAYDADGNINRDLQAEHFQNMSAAGMQVYLPAAGTSEFHSLSADEIVEIVRINREACGDGAQIFAPVGLQVGHAIDVGVRSMEAGATGIMFMPFAHPYMSDEGASDYYRQVIDAVQAPTLIYRKGPIPTDALLQEMAANPHVVGIKYAVNEMHEFHKAVMNDAHGIEWLCGSAERFAPYYMLAGAPGYTTGAGNLCPHLTLAMHAAFAAGQYSEGMRLQRLILPIEDYRARRGDSYNISMLKHGMTLLGKDFGPARAPQRQLTADERGEIDAIVESILAVERELAGELSSVGLAES